MTNANPLKLHHSVVKKATRLGVEFHRASDGGFMLSKDGVLSLESWDSTAEAFEALAEDAVTFEAPRGSSPFSCGVMAKGYHDRYTRNPKGPGCNDDLDCVLRDETQHIPEGAKQPCMNLGLLQQIGKDSGLWRETWERLNPGMQRMNLANRMRGFLRNNPEAELTIGQYTGRFGVEAKEDVAA